MKRTWFMQYLLTTSYTRVALIAIANATLEGSWEQAIEELLKEELKGSYKEEAKALLKLSNGSAREAAKIVRASVTESKIESIK